MTITYRKHASGEHHLVDGKGKVKGIFDSEAEARANIERMTKESEKPEWDKGK